MKTQIITIGVNRNGEDQHFSIACAGPEIEARRKRIEVLWDENCMAAGVDVWSPLALSFAEDIAKGGCPVKYQPNAIAIDSENPHVEYAQMFLVERHRFPSADLYPTDVRLYEHGLATVRAEQAAVITDVVESLRMDGVLLENWQLELRPPRPLADMDTLTANYDGKSVTLKSLKQFRLFHCLAQTPERFVEYLTLAEEVWGDSLTPNKTIQNTLTHVRNKLADAGVEGIRFESAQGRVRMILS